MYTDSRLVKTSLSITSC